LVSCWYIVMSRHKLCRIYITFYYYYISLRTRRTFHRWVKRENVAKAVKFIRKLLDPTYIEIRCVNRKKPYTNEDKLPKKMVLHSILVVLKKCLEVTYEEEYRQIYKPIDEYLMKECKLYMYNMWGYGERGPGWQMDGRHIPLDHIDKKLTNKHDSLT